MSERWEVRRGRHDGVHIEDCTKEYPSLWLTVDDAESLRRQLEAPFVVLRPERDVDRVYVHCSDSDVGAHANVATIRRWHVEGNGWSDIGYHWIIDNEGRILDGRPLERTPAAQRGHNVGSFAVCLTGRHGFSEAQFAALRRLADALDAVYLAGDALTYHPHNEVDARKSCPNFNVGAVLGLDEQGGRSRDRAQAHSR